MLRSDISTQSGHGLVHVLDRVLFPPTVGNVVQTLQVNLLIDFPPLSRHFVII